MTQTKPYDWQDDPEMYTLSERMTRQDMMQFDSVNWIPPAVLPVPVETVIEATLGHAPEITGRA